MRRWFGFILRAGAIQVVLVVSVGGYALGRLRLASERDPERRRAERARLQGRILRQALATLGATFIKLGQVMSTRPDLFEPETIEELRALQDRLPPFPVDHVRALVHAELGGPLDAHFREFDPEPVAAASVAQVNRARLHDGREVAVKVLRPDVRRAIERDAAVLRTTARVLELHPSVRASDLRGHLEHFVEGILAQADLAVEARNYTRFRENFRGVEGVVFPEVHDSHSTEKVLTMQFVRGVKVDEVEIGEHPGLVDRLRNAFLKMAFEDGFLHADLHPGNFVVTEEGAIAVFDVGLVKELGDELLEQFLDFNRCLMMGEAPDYIAHMQRYFLRDDRTVDWDSMLADIDVFVDGIRGKPFSEIEFGTMVHDALALGRKYKVRPETELTLVIVGFITAEGVGKQLEPDVDSTAKVIEFITPILLRRGMMARQKREAAERARAEAATAGATGPGTG